jgi:hypothetical protein
MEIIFERHERTARVRQSFNWRATVDEAVVLVQQEEILELENVQNHATKKPWRRNGQR